MSLTRDYRETIKARLAHDAEFADAIMDELEAALVEIARLEKLLKKAGPQGREIW
jgi:hypothetical protein